VVESVAVDEAAAGEADELRLQVGDGLREIGAEAVFAALEGVLGEEGNLIEGDQAGLLREHDEAGVGDGLAGGEGRGEPLPVRGRRGFDVRLAEEDAVLGLEAHIKRHRANGAVFAPGADIEQAGEDGKIIGLAGLDRDAVEAGVGEANAFARGSDLDERAARVVRVERIGRVDPEVTRAAAAFDEFPIGEGPQAGCSVALYSKDRFCTSSA
jgi:hypothetical protein